MSCQRCGSGTMKTFATELAIHLPGREGLNKSAIFAFADLVVCMNCGAAEFTLGRTEVQRLAEGINACEAPKTKATTPQPLSL